MHDQIGLFTREIEHASNCILNQKIESDVISHADTQSNMFWLDHVETEDADCLPKKFNQEFSNARIKQAFLNQTSKLEKCEFTGAR